MQNFIWIGSLVTLLGLGGLIYCISLVWHAKRQGLEDDAMRQRLQRAIPINMGAMFCSVIGLMMVVIGIAFG